MELRLPRRPCKVKANWNFIFIGPVYEDPVSIKKKVESFQQLKVEMARFSGGGGTQKERKHLLTGRIKDGPV